MIKTHLHMKNVPQRQQSRYRFNFGHFYREPMAVIILNFFCIRKLKGYIFAAKISNSRIFIFSSRKKLLYYYIHTSTIIFNMNHTYNAGYKHPIKTLDCRKGRFHRSDLGRSNLSNARVPIISNSHDLSAKSP